MNIEISDEMAIELIDAHADTFNGAMNYGRLVELVGALLVYIPDPRGEQPPRPVVAEPVERDVRRPKGRLTPHQRGVYTDIVRMSARRSNGADTYRWVDAKHVGSKNACDRLIEKGWIEMDIAYGPRGGELRSYRPIVEEAS